MSRITDAITTAALAAGVKPQVALERLEGKAFVAKANDVEGVYVHAGGGVIAPIKDAVEGLVPAAVRNQTAKDRATYDYVTSRKAARGEVPVVSEGKPKHEMSTSEFMAARKAGRKKS